MTEKQNELPLPATTPEDDIGKAAVARYYRGLGREVDQFRMMVGSLGQGGRLVNGINVRGPRTGSPGHLLVVKTLSEEGPSVSFTGGNGWIETILAFGARLRAGQVEWKEDQFATEGWEEQFEYLKVNRYDRE